MPAAFEEIISDLKKRIYKPVYFLAGDEPYYIDLITEYIEEKVLTEAEKAFNQLIIYGEDTSVNSIIETCTPLPHDGEPPGCNRKGGAVIKEDRGSGVIS